MKKASSSLVVSPELERIAREAAYQITYNTEAASKILKGPRFAFDEYRDEQQAVILKAIQSALSINPEPLGITNEQTGLAKWIEEQLVEIDAGRTSATQRAEWSRRDTLDGERIGLLRVRAFIKRATPSPEPSGESQPAAGVIPKSESLEPRGEPQPTEGVPAEGKINRKKGDEPCPEVLKPDVSNAAPTSDPKGAAHIGGEPQLVDGLNPEQIGKDIYGCLISSLPQGRETFAKQVAEIIIAAIQFSTADTQSATVQSP